MIIRFSYAKSDFYVKFELHGAHVGGTNLFDRQ